MPPRFQARIPSVRRLKQYRNQDVERATGRLMSGVRRQADGAAPLIGSSEAIRRVRERIERVAATDFTILIEGAIGPEPHPSFIDVFGGAPRSGSPRGVEGAREDGSGAQILSEAAGLTWEGGQGQRRDALNAAASCPKMERASGTGHLPAQ